ncbi:hypothetical protein DAPPUDRAFT_106268 [Daphnia pulex]|uniref:Uncharacterized protein n=1 Tax=Daphnia pulex TaxID=6669 RepID=E9GT45_DAPPU|nr:hypothetical protein DAPPUDRAFT_106268 [Daphnia pulex]|eukprot:EFX77335.1 hypothetical protein DAPPUDRAFT_106268 [Daphnia pulex]
MTLEELEMTFEELDITVEEFEIILSDVSSNTSEDLKSTIEEDDVFCEGPVTGLEIISGELEAFLGRLDTTFQELVNFVAGVVLTFGRTTALGTMENSGTTLRSVNEWSRTS